jgi:hypothetical protein
VFWPVAIEPLGGGIGFVDSLPIEVGATEPAMYRRFGGLAAEISTILFLT